MKYLATTCLTACIVLTFTGCNRDDTTGPPEVRLDDDVCAACNMIISDERFAGAVVIRDESDRTVPLLFDDYNCQIDHERAHKELDVLARYVHDYQTRQWIAAQDAVYVRSPAIRSPMASNIAAFANQHDAQQMSDDNKGELFAFDMLWNFLY